ncbi:MAG: ABC transporter ATP-binding protein/permease [Oscillospiraceae bacterium]|nr:ABC transporter ATP-binding protein/permease [Oscillospiraceae bacterium]
MKSDMPKTEKQKKEKINYRKVFLNNWIILKYIAPVAPGYFIYSLITGTQHVVIVFFEHVYMIKFVTDAIQYRKPFFASAVFVGGMLVFLVVKNIIEANYTTSYKEKSIKKISRKIQLDLYEKASKLDLACYDDPEFYNDFVWAMSEASTRIFTVLENCSDFLAAITSILLYGGLMINLNIAGLVFVACSFTLQFTVSFVINRQKFRLDNELKPLQRKQDYINRVFYLKDYVKEIRISDVKEKLYKDFEKGNGEILGAIRKRTKKIAVLDFISGFVANDLIFDGIYTVYLAFLTFVERILSYGSMYALSRAAYSMKSNIQLLTRVIPQMHQNSLYIDKILKFMDMKPSLGDKPDAKNIPQLPVGFEIKNLSFAYNNTSGDSSLILKNISMKVNAGEKIAIVGYNGAGKSTLIKLIMRLYDATGGEILYGDTNIKDYKTEQYRNVFGAVFQDYQLFAATVADNVAMDNAEDSEKSAIRSKLDMSGFTPRLMGLENGADTILTREFDGNGVDLSGGEAQKVAIARMLYRNSQVIIMDEPSSALDPIAEYQLNKTIMESAEGKTIFLISHRLSTTMNADRIYMLENGEIIESGNHSQLMSLNGKYAEMFIAQAEKYKANIFTI